MSGLAVPECMDEVSKSLSFTDPISAMFELNDDLMKRVGRFTYLLEYAHFGGIFVLLLSAPALLVGFFDKWPFQELVLLGMVLGASFLAWWYGRQEVRFLDEFRLRSAALSRAKNWEPHPTIPPGQDPMDRFLSYLKEQDDRFAYVCAKKAKRLEKRAELSGKSGKTYRFDAFFNGWLFSWRHAPIMVFIRLVPTARVEDVQAMKMAVEDVLAVLDYDGPVRAFIVQTHSGELPEEVMQYANEHFLVYERTVGSKTLDWASPVEVIAEDPAGVYNIGSFYFG